jgi:dTDP-4-dehydrorhamnose reductase
MLKLWGGHEPTIRRINDDYIDQTKIQGHDKRISDLDLFAEVGFESLRYPVLWETVSPVEGEFDWTWPDERLTRLKDLGINPIVGLLHHGSGPMHTNLLDPKFPSKLAAYAKAVAERYPWVRDWTPVNEPLTTARFSCLYGIWYPHTRDDKSFWTALLNQIEATKLAMAEIRKVNPDARLIQTEDLGKIYSTPELSSQAEFENTRRWITWDLLSGKYDEFHPLSDVLWNYGLHTRALEISKAPCKLDVLGVNYYLTSERFLDHRLDTYPAHLRGQCGYVDVEAVRVNCAELVSIKKVLREAWERYGLTLAITESHNGSYEVEERLRWIYEAWVGSQELIREGIDIEAVTCWALLGNYDWNSLLTNMVGHYEVGPWSVLNGEPEPNEMVPLLRYFAGHPEEVHPCISEPGWWARNDRHYW